MDKTVELISVSYLNACVYCPRRFFLEYVRGMFEDNEDTESGRSLHKNVDAADREARPRRKDEFVHCRSVRLSCTNLGITARLDLIESKDDGQYYPVEYKKGKKLKNREPWINDQVQLCAQALLMERNGMGIPAYGYIYHIGSRARTEIRITEELIEKTHSTISLCREISAGDQVPPLASNRNKCFGCSLNAICLPEEEEVLSGRKQNARLVLTPSLEGDLLYVDTIGAYVGLSAGVLKISEPGGAEIGSASLETLKEVVLCGPVNSTTQVVHECLKNNIPLHYLNFHGGYLGSCTPLFSGNGLLREAQWRLHFDNKRCLEVAREIVCAKIVNMRTLMMRYLRDDRTREDTVNFRRLNYHRKDAERASDRESMRGFEGISSRLYFSGFSRFVKPERREFFGFSDRNRRPPRDPVNALLSFGYSLLAKDCAGAAMRVGFDPYCGFYHTMKYGRPALALDIMELFRQPVVDSAVLSAINNGVFKESDFYRFQKVCYLNGRGRKKFLAHYEMRKKDMVTHPTFHYRLSYERTIELQYRLLGKFLLGEIESFQGFHIR